MDNLNVKTFSECIEQGIIPEILFWVGCAGSFDERAKKITKAFVKILNKANIKFAVLGKEESCSGDPAKRAGNEFLFQMQAINNIETLNSYSIKSIVTTCPHCFNTIKNEYPELGGKYTIYHHSQFLNKLMKEKKISVEGGNFKGKKITFHDPCYLGRANGVYEAPRNLIKKIDAELIELKRSRSKGLCCGAGGAQMFKDSEQGRKEISSERAEEIEESEADIVAAACPFCNTMISDGLKSDKKEKDNTKIYDIAELIANANDL